MRNSTKNGNLSVQKMYNNITILQYYNMFKRSKIYYIAILSPLVFGNTLSVRAFLLLLYIFAVWFLIPSSFLKCIKWRFFRHFLPCNARFYRAKRVNNLPLLEISTAERKQTSNVLPWNTCSLAVYRSRVFVRSMVLYIIWKNAFAGRTPCFLFFPGLRTRTEKNEKNSILPRHLPWAQRKKYRLKKP